MVGMTTIEANAVCLPFFADYAYDFFCCLYTIFSIENIFHDLNIGTV